MCLIIAFKGYKNDGSTAPIGPRICRDLRTTKKIEIDEWAVKWAVNGQSKNGF